ncbi:hypothetical protein [Hydrogenophaga aquatica]
MNVELTREGWQAVWAWVQRRALHPERQDETEWRRHAQRCLNLAAEGEPAGVSMGGRVSSSGQLEVIRLKPHWYRVSSRWAKTEPSPSRPDPTADLLADFLA